MPDERHDVARDDLRDAGDDWRSRSSRRAPVPATPAARPRCTGGRSTSKSVIGAHAQRAARAPASKFARPGRARCGRSPDRLATSRGRRRRRPRRVRSASTISPTPTRSPGHVDRARVREAGLGEFAAATSCPMIRLAITARGEVTHIAASRRDRADRVDAGQRLADDAARERRRRRLGLPGRTVTVGRRSERPSMKPLRVMS